MLKLNDGIIVDDGIVETKDDAKQLADLYLALAQRWRAKAGLPPILTGAYERRLETKRSKQVVRS